MSRATFDAGPYAGTYSITKINDSTFTIPVSYSSSVQLSYAVQADLEPDQNPSIYTALTWDSAGKCIKEVSHNPALAQYPYPPEDFRTKAGSVYARKGIGIFNTAADPTRTRYEWEYAYNDGGSADSEVFKLPAAGKRDLSTADIKLKIGEGNFVRRKSTPVDTNGLVGSTRTETFTQVN